MLLTWREHGSKAANEPWTTGIIKDYTVMPRARDILKKEGSEIFRLLHENIIVGNASSTPTRSKAHQIADKGLHSFKHLF